MVSAVKLGERPERHTHTDLTDNIWSLMEQCWDHYPWNRPKISSVLGILRDWFVLFFSRWPSADCSIFIISRNRDELLVPVLPPAPSNWFAQILNKILDLTDQLASVALCQEHGIFRTFSLLFAQLAMLFYPSTLFSLSFTLPRKDKTCAIDFMT